MANVPGRGLSRGGANDSRPKCANDESSEQEERYAYSSVRDPQEDGLEPGPTGGTSHRVGREEQQRPHNPPGQDGPSPPSSEDDSKHDHCGNHEAILPLLREGAHPQVREGSGMFPGVSVGRIVLNERIAKGNDARWLLARPVHETRSINEDDLHDPPGRTEVGWPRRRPSDRRSERRRDI